MQKDGTLGYRPFFTRKKSDAGRHRSLSVIPINQLSHVLSGLNGSAIEQYVRSSPSGSCSCTCSISFSAQSVAATL